MVSMRGGDFLFESGEDLSVGYSSHDADRGPLVFRELHVPRGGTRSGGPSHCLRAGRSRG